MVNHGHKLRRSLHANQFIWSVETLWRKEKKLNTSVLSHNTKNLHSEIRLTLSQATEF